MLQSTILVTSLPLPSLLLNWTLWLDFWYSSRESCCWLCLWYCYSLCWQLKSKKENDLFNYNERNNKQRMLSVIHHHRLNTLPPFSTLLQHLQALHPSPRSSRLSYSRLSHLSRFITFLELHPALRPWQLNSLLRKSHSSRQIGFSSGSGFLWLLLDLRLWKPNFQNRWFPDFLKKKFIEWIPLWSLQTWLWMINKDFP